MPAFVLSSAVDGRYGELAIDLIESGLIGDPWLEGEPRFSRDPLWLDPPRLAALYDAAEALAAAHAELAALCFQEQHWVDRLSLSPLQKTMWWASAPHWHVMARADVFWTEGGPRICELNSDTPSGEAEAVLLNAHAAARRPGCADPNAGLERRWGDAVAAWAIAVTGKTPTTVGLVYPTELTEDLSMIALYAGWFRRRGWAVVLGSPYNLASGPDGALTLFGVPCDVVLRHYKTDWWAERRPIWRDEAPYPDRDPLSGPLQALLKASLSGRTAVINPLGAVLTQNKRTLALLWEAEERLSPTARAAIRRYLPYTARLERMATADLRRERERWVLKSDYGCEGDEVIVGAEVTAAFWAEALARAIPERWVAQRRFIPERGAGGATVNHGVYLVAGRGAGLLARLSEGTTDRTALIAPALVRLS